jgi:hypothetical protein
MVTLTNECSRGLGIPGHDDLKSLTLAPGASVEITDAHHAHLCAEVPGVSAFFAMPRGGIRVTHTHAKPAPAVPAPAAPVDTAGAVDEAIALDDEQGHADETADEEASDDSSDAPKPIRAKKSKR